MKKFLSPGTPVLFHSPLAFNLPLSPAHGWRQSNPCGEKSRYTGGLSWHHCGRVGDSLIWGEENDYIYIYIYLFVYLFIYLFTAIGLLTGGSGYFTCKQNMKSVTTKFKLGELHEKHVVA